ncbi:transcriptional protein Swt1p [[Candida] jaroonii]|uniref:Transcriptional protein Swt1p n=1 Tax=[Candida] jaroonii TaxID=467808 RepID=A0ACA9Y4T2_9ASCO|nr:transcriptional protein Swt1p [[Candida] jaroonii]
MLPSRYAPQGISYNDSRRTITVGSKPRPPEYILTRLQQRIEENDSDMMDIDYYETYMISDLLQNQRDQEPRESTDAMELYAASLQNGYRPPTTKSTKSTMQSIPSTQSILIIDTNFMLSNLKMLDEINKRRDQYNFTVVIPIETIRELDGLKRSDRLVDSKTIGVLARWANDWIYAQLAKGAIRGQDYKQRIDKNSTQDDSILDCCLWFKQNTESLVILFSNDKNLCVKALSNEILTVSYKEGMDAELICSTIYEESIHRNGGNSGVNGGDQGMNGASDPGMNGGNPGMNGGNPAMNQSMNVGTPHPAMTNSTSHIETVAPEINMRDHLTRQQAVDIVYNEIFILTKSVIHHCMEESFGEDLDIIRGYDPDSIRDLQDCKEILVRYWHTVFRQFVGRRKDLETLSIDIHDMEDVLDGWKFVLKTLYQILDDRQRAALVEIFERWDELIVS